LVKQIPNDYRSSTGAAGEMDSAGGVVPADGRHWVSSEVVNVEIPP